MKILVGVDGSECSKVAVEHVCKQPWPAGSQMLVVSAVAQPIIASAEIYATAGSAATEVIEEDRRFHQELVSKAEAELRKAGFPTRGKVVSGDAREAIVKTARDEGAHLIVVGSHGRTGFAKLLLGSVASYVVSHAPCNVLVVRPAPTIR